jgi:hypothetical protein
MPGEPLHGTDELPSAVRQLLRDHVHAYEELELLLLMSSQPDAAWTPDDVAVRVRIDRSLAKEVLQRLHAQGVLAEEPAGPAFRPAIAPEVLTALGRAYDVNRLAVMNFMSANALERLRTSALRAFASAFLLGKKQDG